MGLTKDLGALPRLITISSDNNVGINNTLPGNFRLDVSGTTRISGELTLNSTISNGQYVYTLPGSTGVLALTSQLHNPVTIGSPANGLSLSGQVLSLALSGPTTRGALTSEDYNYFFDKVQGNGDQNYLPKYIYSGSGKQIGNSQIFDNGTNVGIGTGSPSTARFQVNSSNNLGAPSLGYGSGATLVASVNGLYGLYTGTSADGYSWMQSTRNDGTVDAYSIIMQPNGGNVGIGTTGAAFKLEVNGSTRITGGSEMFYLRNTTTNTMQGRIGVRDDGAMQIYSYQSGVGYKNILLAVDGTTSGGNVLIGTPTDAGYKLDVNGTGRFGSSLTVNTDGIFGNTRTGNDAGATVLNIIGSSSSSTSAQLNLTQTWNGVQYPVILRNTYNTFSGSASSVFTLSTTNWNGSAAITTERFRIDGYSGNIGIGVSAPPAEKLTIDSGNIKLGTQGRVIFNRSDNLIFTQLYDAGSYFALDNRNGNGFDFQDAGTSKMRITSEGSIINNGVKTQYISGNASVLNTFYFDFTAYPSTAYKIIAGMTHWSAGYASYKECVQFNDSYTNISELSITNHTSAAGGSWAISRPNSNTLRVTHNGGNYDGGANFWIQVIGV